MKKRNAVLLIVALILLVSLPVSGALALVLNRTQEVENVFTPGRVDCEVVETFTNNQKTMVGVQNTSNTSAFLRLRVLAYWQDSKGNIVARPVNYPVIDYDEDKWIYDEVNKTYYCKQPIAVNGVTPTLLDTDEKGNIIPIQLAAPVTETQNGAQYTYYYVLEFIAEAIQSNPADAVKYGWNADVDSNGWISKVN